MASTEPFENGSAQAPKIDPQTAPSDSVDTTAENPTALAEAAAAKTAAAETAEAEKRWPGWPGDCVYRVIVPVLKVGSIIGRKGELIKKMCEESRARIRVLDGPVGAPDRIEEPEETLSPAMDAVLRVFKRVSGLSELDSDGKLQGVAAVAFCSTRLLVSSTQAMSLIGKQGSTIKSIQENTGASIRVLSSDEVPVYATSEERVVEMQGEALKVFKALEAVVGHLRKFLVDHSVLPLFEKSFNTTPTQDRQVETLTDKSLGRPAPQPGIGSDYPLSLKRDSLFLDREAQLESQLPSARHSLYGQDPTFSGLRSSGLGRAGGPVVTQIAQTMQIPLTYAEDIIGIGGTNIAYIRRTSGAVLTVQESRGLPDEITVEIKGTSSQVQTAQQLIQECMNSHKDAIPGSYGRVDSDLRSSYSQLGSSTYPSTSFGGQSYGGYGSSGLGGYSSFR
ncbi:hypothetical protein RJ639_008020, partial [Escallonia herrerae]